MRTNTEHQVSSIRLTNEKVAIVTAKFNNFITENLLRGAKECLTVHGLPAHNVDEYWVPGAFELAFAAKRLTESKRYNAIVCLGCVIRGDTTHYDYVCNEAARGISQVGLESNTPVMFGVITTENLEQAVERSGTTQGNKGYEVTLGAIEMIKLCRQIDNNPL